MTSLRRKLRIAADPADLRNRAAEEFCRRAADAVGAAGRFAVALSGGRTPEGLYALLADSGAPFRARIPWDSTHFFWGDERHVPPNHADSNYKMAYDAMLSKVPVPPKNVHRVAAENPDAAEAAAAYERTLRAFFRSSASAPWPRFDLILLGLGPDGHTASLFPGTDALRENARWVAAPWVPGLNARRITLTPPAINGAAAVLFLACGADKARIVREVLEGGNPPVTPPARRIAPGNGALLWLIDRAAACELKSRSAAL